MKHKVYILILIIAICFFPIKAFGFFTTPDKHIYSMPFGAQRSNADVQVPPVLPEIGQINNENHNSKLLQPASVSVGESNLNADMSWLVSLLSIIIAIIIFILLKFKKML
ncbi:MAG: hypothetical protein AAB925_01570 [Patescibacteria group bacterium]